MLIEFENVSYNEYDMFRRFSTINGSNSLSNFANIIAIVLLR